MMARMAPGESNHPEIRDDSGYELTPEDLDFLQITTSSAHECLGRVTPLGFPAGYFSDFTLTLMQAIWREGIREADVRLQGSSAFFFSGPHKSMPVTRNEIAYAFTSEFGRPPDVFELNQIATKYRIVWPRVLPQRRPFDSLHRLGVSPVKSDFDIQISSQDAYLQVTESITFSGADPETADLENHKYSFIRKEYSDKNFLYLQVWVSDWEERLDRPVNIAIFGEDGPREDLENPALSSHFKETDWVLHSGPIRYEDLLPGDRALAPSARLTGENDDEGASDA